MSDPERQDSIVGRMLADRYRIEATIARGGMARVYRARDERLEREVAIKVLSPPYADDASFTSRFLAEARTAASLSHPSLVHVYDSGSDGDAHFIVMELLDRHRSLRDEIDARGPLPRDEVLRIGLELLAGLRVVHEHGLVHCDVKSGNVMLGPGPAKLIDFGIASPPHEAHDRDTSIGSLQFMSPEQLHGEALTAASDLFSLGVVLYEALTGRVPFPGSTPADVSAAQQAGAVRPPSSLASAESDRLDDVILQALRLDPDQRFHSAEAMAHALGAVDDEISREREDDTTRIVRVPAPLEGYVPPPLPASLPTRPPQRPAGGGVRFNRLWGLLGTLFVLGAVAVVVLLVVIPLLQLGQGGDGLPPGSTPTATQPTDPNLVTVPAVVGMSTADAVAAANEAGLDWTVNCNEDPTQPEGIIAQEPPAGTTVARGSPFAMFSARIADCQG
jgi:eukaryotic-like serine/threonine-protein kinase